MVATAIKERIDASVRRTEGTSPVDKLYDVIEHGIRLPDQRLWSDELASSVADYLASTRQSESPSSRQEPTIAREVIDQMIKAAETYANGSRNHQPAAEKAAFRHRQTQPSLFATVFIQSKLHPSLARFATRYVTADAKIRRRIKSSVFDENTLERHQYTPAEVAEMLKMFIQLDRLAYLDKVIAAERIRESYRFNSSGDPNHLRQEMIRISRQMAREQKRYNQLRKRLIGSTRGKRNERTAEHVRSSASVDYRKIEHYLGREFEQAVAEINEKNLWQDPRSSKRMQRFTDTKKIGTIISRFGVKVPYAILLRLNELARKTLDNAKELSLLSGEGINVREQRTGEIQPFMRERPSRLFGRLARERLERERAM